MWTGSAQSSPVQSSPSSVSASDSSCMQCLIDLAKLQLKRERERVGKDKGIRGS